MLNLTGYGEEARGFVAGLRSLGLPVAARPVGPQTPGILEALARADLGTAKLLSEALGQACDEVALDVVNAPGGASQRVGAGIPTVARTMFETDRLPSPWVERLNAMDAIWVPSRFNLATFSDADLRVPVSLLPDGVDPIRFSPDLDNFPLPERRGFVFLSAFEWSYRKGPDILLGAWARAFRPDDDVTLVLRCYPRSAFGDEDTTAQMTTQVETTLRGLGSSLDAVAPIVILGSPLGFDGFARLLSSADAYVSPTRGEAFGRPFLEALSCSVPVVATRWGGHLDFLDDDDAYLIDVERMATVDTRMDIALYWGHTWAEPSVEHLAHLLRVVAEDDSGRLARSREGRRRVLAEWTWDHVSRIAAELTSKLLDGSRDLTPRGGTQPSRVCSPEGDGGADVDPAPTNRSAPLAIASPYDLPSARAHAHAARLLADKRQDKTGRTNPWEDTGNPHRQAVLDAFSQIADPARRQAFLSWLEPEEPGLADLLHAAPLSSGDTSISSAKGSLDGPSATASIVIPCLNKAHLTRACLAHISEVTTPGQYEVVLVDNGSSDATRELSGSPDGNLQVIHNPVNLGFARACNQGAAAARGRHLVFLNNDVLVQPGWLDALLGAFEEEPKAGIVGAKLLYPDGRIQHAGLLALQGLVLDGLPAIRADGPGLFFRHRFLGQPASLDVACQRAALQAVTGAAVAVRREAFDAAGGFDEGYWNGFEDVDLCFMVRALGWLVIYEPRALAIHLESQSDSRERFAADTNNLYRFNERWLSRFPPDAYLTEARPPPDQAPFSPASLSTPGANAAPS